jgi:hypothetical protein
MQDLPTSTSNVFSAMGRLLAFRLTQKEFQEFSGRHLVLGLVCAWLVGMERYWDDPGAHILQCLGIGSVIYCFRSIVVPLAADLAIKAAELVLP